MKNILAVLLLAFSGYALPAQDAGNWTVTGYVRNEQGDPLPGTRIIGADSIVTVADTSGVFRLNLPDRSATLTLACIGYAGRSIALRPSDFQGRACRIDVVLAAEASRLPEVDIAARRVETVARENLRTHIFDYDFAGDNLVILLRVGRKHLVRLTGPRLELLAELEVAGQPAVLHRACTGVFHLAGPDFAQELVILEAGLDTLPRYDLARFRVLVEPCVLAYRDYFFYRHSSMLNQRVTYWYYDPAGTPHLFARISHEPRLEEARNALEALQMNLPIIREPDLPPNWRGQPYDQDFEVQHPWATGNYNTEHLLSMAWYNHQINHLGWLESIRLDSLYVPLFRSGDTLLLFDPAHDEVRRFSAGPTRAETLPLRIHHADGWQKSLLQDARTRQIYARFETADGPVLKRLHPATFQPEATYRLPAVARLSHHFKIRDGFLYFLGRENVSIPNDTLFKTGIGG